MAIEYLVGLTISFTFRPGGDLFFFAVIIEKVEREYDIGRREWAHRSSLCISRPIASSTLSLRFILQHTAFAG